jgi:hypothetical protein
MIALASDYLVFQLVTGENVPISAEMIFVELMGEAAGLFDPEHVSHAASAVFHYYKHDLGRQMVTVGEFSQTLETVLRGLFKPIVELDNSVGLARVAEADLYQLARESGGGCELFFFPRLRDELRQQLRHAPRIVRFNGLRSCVKELAGTRRWSGRCQVLRDQIIEYLRKCLSAESGHNDLALVVR